MSELKHQLMLNKEHSWVFAYPKSEADAVIAEKDKEIADLVEKNKRLAHKDIIMASETIKDVCKGTKQERLSEVYCLGRFCNLEFEQYN